MQKPLAIHELIEQIKTNLEYEFQNLYVEGEISNLSLSSSGHWYFSLADKEAMISCALFKGDALRNPQIKLLKDGQKIIAHGSISVYPKRGSFQLIIKRILVGGQGDLKKQFEELKQKLMLEGLFDLDRKKAIPAYPRRVAIITAKGAAALGDFIQVMNRRSRAIELVLVPSLVQGENAPKELISALEKVLKKGDFDLIVFARGGGSMEDLWAFNDEQLVRKVAQSKIPVISAIGHQVDFTLIDFVADFRAETPTAAAEKITENYLRLSGELNHLVRNLLNAKRIYLHEITRHVESLSPKRVRDLIIEQFHHWQKRLMQCDLINRAEFIFSLPQKTMRLDQAIESLVNRTISNIKNLNEKIESKRLILEAIGPRQVLKRGYSFVTLPDNEHKVVNSKAILIEEKIKTISIHFQDGSVNAKIHD